MKFNLKKKFDKDAKHFAQMKQKYGQFGKDGHGQRDEDDKIAEAANKDALEDGEKKAPAGHKKLVWLCAIGVFIGLLGFVVKRYLQRKNDNLVQGEPVNYDNISFA